MQFVMVSLNSHCGMKPEYTEDNNIRVILPLLK